VLWGLVGAACSHAGVIWVLQLVVQPLQADEEVEQYAAHTQSTRVCQSAALEHMRWPSAQLTLLAKSHAGCVQGCSVQMPLRTLHTQALWHACFDMRWVQSFSMMP
jgi:hypothetical protein